MVTLEAIKTIIDQHEPACSCGQVLSSWDIKAYEHSGGVTVEYDNMVGKGSVKLWIYANCPACDIDTKLAVLLARIQIKNN
jgi:hypothetical protein